MLEDDYLVDSTIFIPHLFRFYGLRCNQQVTTKQIKTMKLKYIIALAAAATVFTSCEKANEEASDTTDVAAVREAATAELAEAVETAAAEKAAAEKAAADAKAAAEKAAADAKAAAESAVKETVKEVVPAAPAAPAIPTPAQ